MPEPKLTRREVRGLDGMNSSEPTGAWLAADGCDAPLCRPLRIKLQAGCAPGSCVQQYRQPGVPPLFALRAALAFESLRFGFPLTLSLALTDLVAILVICVHDAS